jgi:tetratricopeptide (TPR) repeat protein
MDDGNPQASDDLGNGLEGLVRQQQDRHRAVFLTLQEMAEELNTANLESLRSELDLLNGEELATHQNSNLPLRERLELADLIRRRRADLEQQIAEMESVLVKRLTEVDLKWNELEGGPTLAELRREMERQDRAIASLEARMQEAEARQSTGAQGRLGWIAGLLALLLLVAVGVAGVLLPVQEDEHPAFGLADLYLASGEVYSEARDYEMAVGFLRRAVNADPGNATSNYLLAEALYQLQDYEGAQFHYLAAVHLEPHIADYLTGLGWARLKLGHYQEAAAAFDQSIELDAANRRTHHGNAWALFYLGDHQEALSEFEVAEQLGADRINCMLGRGVAYTELGQHAAAIEALTRLTEWAPTYADGFYRLGEAYRRAGRCDEATNSYNKSLEIDTGHRGAQQGLEACSQ